MTKKHMILMISKSYDSTANLVRKVEKEYTKINITEKDLEEVIADPKHFPPFQTLRADDNGRVYVLTNDWNFKKN